jgi:phage recombination protein Bet
MTPSETSLLRRTITAHLSDDEHALFLAACERSGLDPFARQIYAMRKANRLVIEATIDGLRLSAERTGKYAGQLGPEWCGPDGIWLDIWTSAVAPTAARVGIKRSDFSEPIWGKALYSEYMQETEFWRDMPTLMLAKVAEALALRKAFPQQFSGLYTPEEMATAKSVQTISGSSASHSEAQPRRVGTPGGDPGRGEGANISPAIPAPLRPFLVEGRAGNHRNVKAAFRFIQGELENALGVREGAEAFRRIYIRLPRIFKTREECNAATLACWCELWREVERAGKREAA